jgi:hypothetical protein
MNDSIRRATHRVGEPVLVHLKTVSSQPAMAVRTRRFVFACIIDGTESRRPDVDIVKQSLVNQR